MLESTGQFVLLEHVRGAGRHWDLMFEAGSGLATWQLTQNPIFNMHSPDVGPISAQRLADHRHVYLDYQGEISGGRGFVTRVDRGRFILLAEQPDRISLELSGKHLHGKCELIKSTCDANKGETWILVHNKG